MSKATETQVDGNHYSKLKIQPMMLAYSIGASPCFMNVCKYITRDKDAVYIQLTKAMHCIDLEAELIADDALYGCDVYAGEVGQLPYYQKIVEFSEQFEHSQSIGCILFYLHDRQYAMARMHLGILTREVLKDDKQSCNS